MWELIVDPSVELCDGAEQRLREATAVEDLPKPVLLAAKVVDPAGALHPASAPLPDVFAKDLAAAAAERGLVSLRATRPGALLVNTKKVGRPDGDLLAWTSRVLRSGGNVGYLVPRAIGNRDDAADGRLRPRVLLTRGWSRDEKLWLASLVIRDAARRLRRAAP